MIADRAASAVSLEIDGAVAIVTLTNPEKRNALSRAMMSALVETFETLGADREIKAIVLRSEGSAFSAGHDLREVNGAGRRGDVAELRDIFDLCVRMMTLLQSVPQPVIAEVAGIASAAGCQLVASCDLALASSEARFATPGVNIGLFCTTPMVALTRSIGRKRALEMLLTGDFIDAETAERWGLVNRVVAPAALHDEALALARKIARASGFTVGLGKAAFYAQVELDQAQAYAYAKEVMSMNALHGDAHEGMGAFLERRAPEWKR
jgi:enoyl-CoA hydratase/carnithine racemase